MLTATTETQLPKRESPEFAGQVRTMFDRIAGVYDLMNTAMTAGMHHRWRQRAVERANLRPGDSALDVCCGTGDLAFELARRVGPGGEVVGCDFSDPMLDLARRKAAARHADQVRFEWADALELPFPDRAFDAVTVGFGVRNLADLGRGLGELHRALKPGGRLVILEITRPLRLPLSAFYSVWFDRAVPILGAIAGDRDAYAYLPESVKRFPSPQGLAEQMALAGFGGIRYLVLAGGIIAIHSGARPR
ncbi:MAG: bifunctional demethylmenaquinone methyltransferase/2-methoxy-6-polyprenyl-1,4-benzoquinol methylase UbiE [Solirubrobacterales bacterium]